MLWNYIKEADVLMDIYWINEILNTLPNTALPAHVCPNGPKCVLMIWEGWKNLTHCFFLFFYWNCVNAFSGAEVHSKISAEIIWMFANGWRIYCYSLIVETVNQGIRIREEINSQHLIYSHIFRIQGQKVSLKKYIYIHQWLNDWLTDSQIWCSFGCSQIHFCL